jgi:MoxR-like ATPase
VSDTDGEARFKRRFSELTANIELFIHGKTEVVRLALVGLFAEGHLLIEDVPGVAKTSLAKAIARSIDTPMGRIQFTPDLLPSDVTGVQVFDQVKTQFTFRPGPVFAHVVLADEINRAAPKTQSALLEVMGERQTTVDGESHPLPRPFLCIATQNPIEHRGTYPLPEAQLDRFLMLLRIGYPELTDEVEVVDDGLARREPEQLEPVLSVADILEMIEFVRGVHVAPALREYLVRVVAATRRRKDLRLGASPRGSVALARAAQSHAACHGRSYTTADDVQAVAVPVLGHRLIPAPEYAGAGGGPDPAAAVVRDILKNEPVPTESWIA